VASGASSKEAGSVRGELDGASKEALTEYTGPGGLVLAQEDRRSTLLSRNLGAMCQCKCSLTLA